MGCFLCGHPIQYQIDTLLQTYKLEQLLNEEIVVEVVRETNALIDEYMTDEARRVKKSDIRQHALDHDMITRDGQLVNRNGREYIQVGSNLYEWQPAEMVVKTAVALGFANMLQNPEQVSPNILLKFLEYGDKANINIDKGELAEFMRERLSLMRDTVDASDGPFSPPGSGDD